MMERHDHPDDIREMRLVGEWLKKYRHSSGINAARASRALGHHEDFLRSIETAVIVNGRFPAYTTMQAWTQILDLYFSVEYTGFDDINFDADETLTGLRLMAGLGDGRNQWAIAAAIDRLRVVREQRGLSAPAVGKLRGGGKMGGNHKRWEEQCENPRMYMLFDVARVLGGRARLLIGDSFAGAVRVTRR